MKAKRILMSLAGVLICAVSVAVFKIAAFGVDPLIQFFCKHIAEPMLANRD